MNAKKNLSNDDSTLSRKERKANRTKNLILDSAEKLFSKLPYDEVKVDDIANDSALSKATVYSYFHSKEGLYYSIGIRAYQFINNQIAALDCADFSI